MKDQQKWFESLSVGSLHQRFAIDTEELGLIGTANLVDINWKDKMLTMECYWVTKICVGKVMLLILL